MVDRQRIRLSDKYFVDVDPMNWMLVKKEWVDGGIAEKGRNKGKEVEGHYSESVIGYYASYENVVKAYLDRLVREKEPTETDIIGFAKEYKEIIERAVKEFKNV